jgi:molecular chaperone DnaJ
MANREDLYKILELTKNASDDEIKASYKKLVKKWHPDKNQDNKEEATRKFREISEAYSILSDPLKRKTYDNFGFDGFDESHPDNNGPFGFDPFSMFKNFFQKEDEVPEVQINIELTLEELYSGVKKKVKFDRYSLCKVCNAKGRTGNDIDCKKCNGKGVTIQKTGFGIMQNTCRDCGGKGVNPKSPKCKECNGEGCFKENHTLNVTIPKGSSEKHPIIIDNEGNEIPENERNEENNRSSVIIIISEIQHQKFNRGTVIKEIGKINESNLMIEIKLTLEESLCGFEKKFTHLDGKHFSFSMNEVVRHGDIYVMKGLGMPYYQENKFGDLIIKLYVEKKEITSEKKNKLWKLLSNGEYVEVKKKSNNIIPYEQYKSEMMNEDKKESMKNRYKYRETSNDNVNMNVNGCAQQ